MQLSNTHYYDSSRIVDAHKVQSKIYDDKSNRHIVCAGRGGGKSYLIMAEALRVAISIPNSRGWIIGQSYDDVKDVFFDKIKEILEIKKIDVSINNSTLTFRFKNKSTLRLYTVEKLDRLRGRRLDFLGLDEAAFYRNFEYLWKRVFLGLLKPTARVIIASSPNGFNYFKEMWDYANDGNDINVKAWHFTYKDSLIPGWINKVEADTKELTNEEFRQEYLAEFIPVNTRALKQFSTDIHVQNIPYNPNYQLRLGCDFNVNPMCWCIFQILPKEEILKDANFPIKNLQDECIVFLKDYKIKNTNTQLMCQVIRNDLKNIYNYQGEITFYGDSTAKKRTTNSYSSDWDIIKEYFPNAFFDIQQNPLQRDRINAVERKVMTRENYVGLFINSDCKNLIRDFLETTTKDDGTLDKVKEAKTSIGHLFDASTYPIYTIWGIQTYSYELYEIRDII